MDPSNLVVAVADDSVLTVKRLMLSKNLGSEVIQHRLAFIRMHEIDPSLDSPGIIHWNIENPVEDFRTGPALLGDINNIEAQARHFLGFPQTRLAVA